MATTIIIHNSHTVEVQDHLERLLRLLDPKFSTK